MEECVLAGGWLFEDRWGTNVLLFTITGDHFTDGDPRNHGLWPVTVESSIALHAAIDKAHDPLTNPLSNLRDNSISEAR